MDLFFGAFVLSSTTAPDNFKPGSRLSRVELDGTLFLVGRGTEMLGGWVAPALIFARALIEGDPGAAQCDVQVAVRLTGSPIGTEDGRANGW